MKMSSTTQDVLMVDSLDQAATMLKPLRVSMLRELTEPRTCPQLAAALGQTPQKVYYHVKTLQKAGLVERCGERLVNGIKEGFYRARARAFWLSPGLVRRMGGDKTVRDHASLRVLAGHAEEMIEDVGRLAQRSDSGEHIPSLSLGVEIALPTVDRRSEFLEQLRTTFEDLARRYMSEEDPETDSSSETFRFTLSCYPKP